MSLRTRLLVIALALVALGAAPALVGLVLALLEVETPPERLRLGWIAAVLSAYAAGAVVLVVLADLLLRRALAGLEGLAEALRRVARGEPPPALPPAPAFGAREVGEIAEAYRLLAGRLAAAEAQAARAGEALARGERLASVGRIAAGVAHDLKNPIAALVGYARLLRDAVPAGSPLCADVDRIAAEADRAASIVRDLRDLARPPRPEVGPTDLTAAVRTAVDLVRRSNAVPIDVRGADVHVEADGPMLREAFVNLLANAARAALERGDSGRVDVRVEARTAAGAPGRREAVVEVADNGPGIAPEVRARLFEPFVTAAEGGTGLGLATARRVVESHGGRIEVETGGAGTTFRVILPRVLAP